MEHRLFDLPWLPRCASFGYDKRIVDKDCFVSNSLYDQNKMVTHCILKHPDTDMNEERIVSDVELAMSDSPEVTSLVSSEYRKMLQLGLQNQQRSPARDKPLSDDDLLKFTDIGNDIERPELDSVIRDKQNRFYNNAVAQVYDTMQTESVSTSNVSE